MSAQPADRLLGAFAVLAERGTPAGADAVWRRALLAAAIDGAPALGEGGSQVPVPVAPVRPVLVGVPDLVEVGPRPAIDRDGGRRRVAVAIGVAAAVVIGAGVATVAVRGGGSDGMIGAPVGGDATSTVAVAASTMAPATTAGITDTTAVLVPSGPFGVPCSPGGGGTVNTVAVATTMGGSGAPPTTGLPTSADTACVYPGGSLPPVDTGTAGDNVETPITVLAGEPLRYWRMLDDLDLTWRTEAAGTTLYWRTPAGQSGAPDVFGGNSTLTIPSAGHYIVLARAAIGPDGPGQRPIQVRAQLADGSVVTAPLVYDNDIGLGHATIESAQPLVSVTAS